jgi:3'-phosphoadenosine 5'-phosphosulfate sulfotransferase (PAPS reductase)/FAD synthetase
MTDKLLETTRLIADACKHHDSVCVAYSGGKDSLAVTEFCVMNFKRVTAFQMNLIPGLRYDQERRDFALQRWGLHVLPMLHHGTVHLLRNAHYGWPGVIPNNSFVWGPGESYAMAAYATHSALVATGQRSGDYCFRGADAHRNQKRVETLHPILGWNTYDVRGFLKSKDIPLPPSSGRKTTGIDLSTPSILWLHKEYPDDYERICKVFPFVEAIVRREEMYGETEKTSA